MAHFSVFVNYYLIMAKAEVIFQVISLTFKVISLTFAHLWTSLVINEL